MRILLLIAALACLGAQAQVSIWTKPPVSDTATFGPVSGPSGTFEVRDGTNAQTLCVYNTYTNATNYERGCLSWSSNVWFLRTQAAGTGTARGVRLQAANGGILGFDEGNLAAVSWAFQSTNHLLPGTDNAYDVGDDTHRARTGFFVKQSGKQVVTGTVPVIGACGTSPSVAGNDNAMLVTVGTGGVATSCAVTFSAAWTTNAPICVAQNDTDRVAYSIVTSTTAVTVTATAAFTASSHFHILCTGRL